MRVYRVEHKISKVGAYNHGLLITATSRERRFSDSISDAHEKLPSGDEDFGCKMYGSLYGFKTKEQLERWFNGWIRKLHLRGFHIAIYEARSWQWGKSKMQLCFLEYDSKIIGTESLLTLRKRLR